MCLCFVPYQENFMCDIDIITYVIFFALYLNGVIYLIKYDNIFTIHLSILSHKEQMCYIFDIM